MSVFSDIPHRSIASVLSEAYSEARTLELRRMRIAKATHCAGGAAIVYVAIPPLL